MKKKILFSLTAAIILLASCTTPDILPREPINQDNLAKAWLQLFTNQFKEALYEFEKLYKEYPDNPRVVQGLALAKFSLAEEFESFDLLFEESQNAPHSVLSKAILEFIEREIPFKKANADKLADLWQSISQSDTSSFNKYLAQSKLMKYYTEIDLDVKTAINLKNQLYRLSNWQIAGPISNISSSALEKDVLKLQDPDTKTLGDLKQLSGPYGKTINWEKFPFNPPNGSVKVTDYYSNYSQISAYAANTIRLEQPQHYLFIYSGEGAFEIFLNKEMVTSSTNYNQGYEQAVFARELKATNNRIIVKISNEFNHMDFSLSAIPISDSEFLYWQNPPESKIYSDLFSEKNSFHPEVFKLCRNLEENPEQLELYFWTAYYLHTRGFIKQSETLLALFEKKLNQLNQKHDYESSSLLRFLHSKNIFLERKFEKAIDIMAREGEKHPDFSPGVRYLITQYERIGNYSRSLDTAQKLLKTNQNWYYGLLAEIQYYTHTEKTTKAMEAFKHFRVKYPDTPDAYFNLLNLSILDEINIINKLRTTGRPNLANFLELESKSTFSFPETKKLLDFYLFFNPSDETILMKKYESDSVLAKSPDNLIPGARNLLNKFPLSLDIRYTQRDDFLGQAAFLELILDRYHKGSKEYRFLLPIYNNLKNHLNIIIEEILKLNPRDYQNREILWTLKKKDSPDKFLEQIDSLDIIEKQADYTSNNDAAYLLQDTKEIFFGDGGIRIHQHDIIKILSQRGVEVFSTITLQSHPYYDDLLIDEAFTKKDDGSIKKALIQGNRVSFTGLEPGDSLSIKYSTNAVQTKELYQHFWSSSSWYNYYPILEKNWTICFPNNLKITEVVHNDPDNTIQREEKSKSDYSIVTYSKKEISPIETNGIDYDFRNTYPWIDISTLDNWSTINQWYTRLYKGQCQVTPEIEQKVNELTQGLKNDQEKLRSIFDFVSQSIQYEDLNFQYSAFIPQKAESVLNDSYGDCKDKAVLLITMLKAIGISSDIALSNPDYKAQNYFLPSNRFTHVIVVLKDLYPGMVIDPTSGYYSYPELPSSLWNSYYLPIGYSTEKDYSPIVLQNRQDSKNLLVTEIYRENNQYILNQSRNYSGDQAALIRSYFFTKSDQHKKGILEDIVNYQFPGFRLSSYTLESMSHLKNTPNISLSGIIPDPFLEINSRIKAISTAWTPSLTERLSSYYQNYDQLKDSLLDLPILQLPHHQMFIITLPDGYRFINKSPNQSITFKEAKVSYRVKQIKNRIIVEREILIPRTVIKEADIPEFKTFLDKIFEKEKELILFEK